MLGGQVDNVDVDDTLYWVGGAKCRWLLRFG